VSDLSLAPKAGLLALINAKSSAPATLADLQEIFPPQVIANAPTGQPNTQVTVRTTLDFSHAGRVTLSYHRLDLSAFTPYQMNATIEDVGTLADYLAMLTTRYGIYFDTAEVSSTVPFDASSGELTYTFTLQANPTSYMYVGSGDFIVHVVWRFDDPELIEQNVSQLRIAVQIDLPNSISTFLQS
jgi:hypothetical protein